jgi:hypothetical protein
MQLLPLLTRMRFAGLGYPGISPWAAANTSYCWWWGVTCCGQTLTEELTICGAGAGSWYSVSALELPAVGLKGTLPDVFDQLPDLQVLDVSYNRGVRAWVFSHATHVSCL